MTTGERGRERGEPDAHSTSIFGLMAQLFAAVRQERPLGLRRLPFLLLMSAVAEFLTVGSIVPFVTVLLQREMPATSGSALLGRLHMAGANPSLIVLGLLIVGLVAVATGARLLVQRAVSRIVFELAHRISRAAFHRAVHQPYGFFASRNSADQFTTAEKVQATIFSVVLPLMQGATAMIVALAIIAVMMLVAPVPSVIVGVAIGIVYLAASRMFRPRLQRASKIVSDTADARMRILREAMGGLRDILISHSQPIFEREYADHDAALRRAQSAVLFAGAAPRFVIEATGIVTLVLVVLLLSHQAGGVTGAIPMLATLVLGAQRLLPLANAAYAGWSQASGSSDALRSLLLIVRSPVVPPPPSGAALPFDRAITLRGAGLAYPSGRTALEAIDLAIPKGSRIAIVGPSGSGKSSLLDLVTGLIAPSTGQVLIDDVPLGPDTIGRWQRRVALVSQVIHVADTSIAANIAFGAEDMDMARVRRAAEGAQLAPFVNGLPQGFDTPAGDHGLRLSGGQRQRIAIARALYRQADLLVLDEPTGQLDPETEAAVLDAILRLDRAITVILVSHNVAALARFDTVYRIADARLSSGPILPKSE